MGPLPRKETLRLMRCACAHVCPSRYETPGLANLEAAIMGCSLAVPDCPPIKEYLCDAATYFTPGDLRSLRLAALTAVKCDADLRLVGKLRSEYTWRAAAEETLVAYRIAMAGRARRSGPRTPRSPLAGRCYE